MIVFHGEVKYFLQEITMFQFVIVKWNITVFEPDRQKALTSWANSEELHVSAP